MPALDLSFKRSIGCIRRIIGQLSISLMRLVSLILVSLKLHCKGERLRDYFDQNRTFHFRIMSDLSVVLQKICTVGFMIASLSRLHDYCYS